MPRWLAESLGVSLAAQAATLPIVLVSFGRLAILSPAVNLLVVPLVAPAMAAGVVALVGGAHRGRRRPAGDRCRSSRRLAGSSCAILDAVVETAASLPFASVTLGPPFDLAAAAAAALGLVALTWWRRRRSGRRGARMPHQAPVPSRASPATRAQRPAGARPAAAAPKPGRTAGRAAIVALIVALVVAGGVVAARPAGIARVSILDVGQGDAILVEGSRGGRLLVDGGPDPDRLLVVLDERIPPWDRRIDAVILTHPHEDHVAGLALLLARYHVGRVFEPGMIGPGPGYAAWQRTLSVVGSATRGLLAAGDRLSVDEIALRVLWPIRGQVPATPPDGGTGINNVSVVLLGQVGERRFLLMGDVEEGIDPSLLKDRLATRRPAQGRPPRQQDRDDAGVRRRRAPGGRRRVGRDRQSVRSSGEVDPRPTRGVGGAGPADRSRRDGRRRVRGGRHDGPGRGRPTGCGNGPGACATGRSCERDLGERPPPSPRGIPVRDPGHRRWFRRPPSRRLPLAHPGRSLTVGYHRSDDGAWAGGGRLPPALPGSPALVRAARARRRRGRGLAGGPDRRSRDAGRSTARRGRRTAPRHRQGAPGRRSGARPPPRRGLGGLADPGRPPRAGASGREPPGDPARRRRGVQTLGGFRDARGADRRLRGQAGQPAARVARCPVRPLAAPAPDRGSSTVGPAAGTRRPIGPSGPAPRDSRPTSAAPPG